MTKCKLRILAKKLCDRHLLRLLSTTGVREHSFTNNDTSEKKTHFGFETVTEAEKEDKG